MDPGASRVASSCSGDSSKQPSTSKFSPIVGNCLRRSSTQRSVSYYPSGPGSGSSSLAHTPHSSPGSVRKTATKKLVNAWAAIKKFSPVRKIKSSHWTNKARRKQLGDERLSFSHPDVSCSNLAGLAYGHKRSRDDMDLILSKNNTAGKSTFLRNVDEDGHEYCFERQSITTEVERQSENTEDDARQRLAKLRQYPFFQLEVHLHSGRDLLAKDAGGTSDPYIKFKLGNKQVYKSRTVSKTLSPKWDEYFLVTVEDVFQPLVLRVFDHDFGFQDDYLGTASVDLTQLRLNTSTHLSIRLSDTGKENEDYWGEIELTATLLPKTQEEKEHLLGKTGKTPGIVGPSGEMLKKQKTQQWDSVVNVILVEGKNLESKDENGLSDPYVKFKLGNEKYRSKVISKTLNPQWNEQFDLHTFPDQSKVLEVAVYDKDFHGKDDFMGKCTVNLNNLEKEETHSIWKDLEGGEGSVLLVVTVSGTLGSEALSDLSSHAGSDEQQLELQNKYSLRKTFADLDDIGFLTVKVYRAESLLAADFSGKSDPFCVLQLGNARLQTNTEYKTLSPEWNKIFTFRVKDVHEVLEVTVFDEDRDKKVEFLGKVAIPLLRIKSSEKKWYSLKDKKLIGRSKGQILLELNLVYNSVRACIRTLNPREDRFIVEERKFKRSVFVRNVTRIKTLVMEVVDIAKFVNSCFQWESVPRSIFALIIFLLLTYFFESYMVPLALLLITIKNYCWASIASYFNASYKEDDVADDYYDGGFDDDDDDNPGKGRSLDALLRDDTESLPYALDSLHEILVTLSNLILKGQIDYAPLQLQEEKKTLKEKFQTVQEVTAMVQNVLGDIASLGERAKNTFNFSVPFLTWLALIAFSLVSVVLYYIPLRYLVMAWGINKFTKKLRNPNAISNNEVLDFLSRVPDNDERVMFRELKAPTSTIPTTEASKKGKKKAA